MRQWYNIIDIIPLRIWFLHSSHKPRRFILPEGCHHPPKKGFSLPMIDFNEYKTYFDTYAARYDKADGRVALKIVHTYAVVSVMETLCRLRCRTGPFMRPVP